MFGVKTNERPGTRAEVRYARFSASKARVVLDLIRGLPVEQADEILQFTERGAADVIRKCLASAVANAEHNDSKNREELAVVACFADEGPTMKRMKPGSRGRAGKIRKRSCHITVIVDRMSDAQLEQQRAKDSGRPTAGRRRPQSAAARRERVARSRAAAAPVEEATFVEDDTASEAVETDIVETDAVEADAVEASTEVTAQGEDA
jgi:large subunit ribosomal protein L22